MKNWGWKGEIKAAGTERHAYSTIARTVPIPRVCYNWSAPQLDQGDTPQCGPYSFVEIYYGAMRQNGLSPLILDPADLARSYEKYTEEPFTGVYNRIMMAVAAQAGVLCRPSGERYKIAAYHQVDVSNLDEVLNCLAEGYNFLAGFSVYRKAFEEATNGIVTMPGKGDEWLGGHDCSFQGYDLNRRVIYGQNHWRNWGAMFHTFVGNCHFEMPIEYLTRLGSDAWTITLT